MQKINVAINRIRSSLVLQLRLMLKKLPDTLNRALFAADLLSVKYSANFLQITIPTDCTTFDLLLLEG